jgi:hypothetical protein
MSQGYVSISQTNSPFPRALQSCVSAKRDCHVTTGRTILFTVLHVESCVNKMFLTSLLHKHPPTFKTTRHVFSWNL